MAVDGYLNFNTKVSTDGFDKGADEIVSKTKTTAANVEKTVSGLKSLLSKLAVAASAAFSVRAIVNFGKEAVNLASDLQEVQNVVDVSFGNLSYQMEELADKAIETYGISELTAKQTGSTYMAMAKGMSIADDAAADMALTLTGLSADMASFYNEEQSVTATALNSVFTGETETLKKFGIVMTEANLQNFAYTQGINKKISAMSQAEKVQLRYNYVLNQTALAQGDFVRTQDSWANQTRILSEQWSQFSGTVGTILMQTLLPAVRSLNKAMSALNSVAQRLLENLAAIFDWDIETSGVSSSVYEDISDAIGTSVDNQNALTDAAEETAKAQKRQLMSFDKINKLSDDSSSSGSSSPGSVSGGTNTIPIDVDTSEADKKLTDFQKKIKGFVSSLKITFNDVFIDWEDLTGEQIAEKIITALGGILGGVIGFTIGGVPGAIVGSIVGIGLSLIVSSLTFDHDGELGGEEILSMISMALLGIAGGLIGFSVGGVGGAAIGVTIGAAIAFAINELSFNTDGALTGEEIVKYAISALGAIAGGIIGFSVGGAAGAAIGIAIGATFSICIADISFDDDGNLSADEIIGLIVTTLCGIGGAVIGFSVGGMPGAVVGATIGMALSMFINEITFDNDGTISRDEIGNMISTALLGLTGGVIGGLTGGAPGALVGFSIGTALSLLVNSFVVDWGQIVDDIKQNFSDLWSTVSQLWEDAQTGLGNIWSGLSQAAEGGISSFTEWCDGIAETIDGLLSKAIEFGGNFVSGLFEGISNAFSFIGSWLNEHIFTPFVTAFKDLFGIHSPSTVMAELGGYLIDGLKEGIGDIWAKLQEKFSTLLTNIKTWFTEKKAEVTENWQDFTSGVKDKTVELKGKFTQTKEDITKWWTDRVSAVKDKTAEMKASVKTKVEDLKKAWNTRSAVIKGKTAKMKASVATKVKDLKASWKTRSDVIKDKTAKAKINFSQTKEKIKEAAQKRYNAITEVFGGIPEWFKTKFSDAWGNVKKVFSSGGDKFEAIKNGILDSLKAVINGLIDGINKVIKVPFDGINTALTKIKDISIGGVTPFKDKIKLISVPQIPKLATGTVVPANYGEFLAVLGDNKRETEVVSPLNTIKQAVAEVLDTNGGDENINLNVYLDSDVVYKSVVKKHKQNKKITGVNAFA